MKKLLMVLMGLILTTFSIIGCSPPAEEPQTSDTHYYAWSQEGSEPPPSTDIDITSDTPPTTFDITYVEGELDLKWTKPETSPDLFPESECCTVIKITDTLYSVSVGLGNWEDLYEGVRLVAKQGTITQVVLMRPNAGTISPVWVVIDPIDPDVTYFATE